jgi:hypothetical protein
MSQGWSAPTPPDTWSWFVTDGQGSNKGAAHGNTALGWYRPGDEVRLKGWLNRRGPDGRLREIAPGALQVRWSVDPGGGPVRPFSFGAAPPEPLPLGPSGTAALSPLGGFHVRFTVPERVAGDELGVNLELEGDDAPDWGESFVLRVLAPAAPTVDVSMGGPTDRWIGESIELTARIRSPAGAPVEGEGLHWAVHATPARFAPPGWPGFSFGDGRPAVEASHDLDLVGAAYAEVATLDIDGGHSGGHRAILHLDSGRPAVPRLVQVRAQASVPGGWTPASWQTLVVHPAERTVGLFLDAPMVTAGEPVELRAVVVDLEGEPVPDVPVQVRVVPLSRGGSWTETGPELAGCDLVSGAGSVACELRIDGAGPHRVKAVVHGGAGRPSESWLTVHVANPSAEPARWPRVEVAPDREVYAARDRARLEIEAPARATFVDAPGLVLVAGLDGLQTLPFQLEGRRAGVEVPVPEQSCWLDVELVGHAPPEGADPGPNGIRWAATRRALEVPPDHLGLVVEVVPMLGTLNTMAVVVSDADGQPVGGAEVALFGVDDAILDPLRPPPDPLGQLHAPLYEGGLRPADSTRLAAAFAQPRGEARQSMLNDVYHSPCSAGHAPASKPPFEPGRCAAGPLFEPELLTSAEGVVEIELDPALMERGCRLLAVAAAPGGRYGAGLNGVGRR